VTNGGPTVVNGNLGLSPGSALTGFPPGNVILPYTAHIGDGAAVTAQNDLTIAYNDAAAANRDGGPVIPVSGDLGGLTLTPGLYNSATTLGITGVLTLNGQGNANSVFVFQIGSALTTAVGSSVVLINGAGAANIFWQVGSSATLGTNSIFNGTILAQASVTLNSGAALNGRALARTGAVTLASNTLTQPGAPGSGGPLTVTCPSNAAEVSFAYNSILSATGGVPPYTYSITGALPPGLSLNGSTGAITGVPTTAGSNTFTVNAADSMLGAANQSCSISTALFPAPTPLPSSLSFVLIGLVCTAFYLSRDGLARLIGRG
jgi:hypothetical protein